MALIGYRVGLYGRKPLKQFGISMFMGRNLDAETLAEVVTNFVSEAGFNRHSTWRSQIN